MEIDKSGHRKEEDKKEGSATKRAPSPDRKEMPINALEKYIYSRRTIEVLHKKGVKNLFPIQYETYDIIYDKYDLIARQRTGMGKTLAFSLPIIERFREKDLFKDSSTKFLIVLPTRELANQVKNEIASLKYSHSEFSVVPVYGGTHMGDQISEIKRGADIIVSTPGRLLDLLERGVIRLDNLRVVCLDEADQMLRQGFQEDIEKIFKYVKKHTDRETQNLLFSATIPSWVHDLSKKYLADDRKFIDLVKNSEIKTPKSIQHLAIRCSYRNREAAISDVIDFYGGKDGRTIVFTETKREANDIGARASLGQRAEILHGDIPQRRREYVFKNFKQGRIRCIVATNVAARGLDIPEVDLVVQLEPPKDIETYIHRAGRTGRAGRSGVCLTFYTDDQSRQLGRIEHVTQIKIKDVPMPNPKDREQDRDRDRPREDDRQHLFHAPQEHSNHYTSVGERRPEPSKPYGSHANGGYTNGHSNYYGVDPSAAIRPPPPPPLSQVIAPVEAGHISCLLKAPREVSTFSFVYNFLRKVLQERTVEQIRNMTKVDTRSVFFELPLNRKEEMVRLAELIRTESGQERFELEVNPQNFKPTVGVPQPFLSKPSDNPSETQIREAQRRRSELQVVISNLPSSTTEQELTEFFLYRQVHVVQVRLSRNDKLEAIGTAYALCLDDHNFKEALKLSGTSLGTRTLNIAATND